VTNYFAQIGVGEFLMESGELLVGEEILVVGDTTGMVKCKIERMMVDDDGVEIAKKGDAVTFVVPEKIRVGDKLFVIRNRV
jgi:putative protease